MDTKILRLEEIVIDNSLNPRIGALDQETVLDYSAHLDDLPAMTVFDGRHWPEQPGFYLVGGFHRFAAHQLAGQEVAKFVVRQGSREAAEEAADLDNLTHGLHLTRAERRGVIVRYLKRHPERSDVWVAKDCRTTDKTVRTVREELEAKSEIPRLEKFVGVDGIERPRSVERPQKPDPDEEARKLTQPFEQWSERLEAEARAVTPASPAFFTAQPCPDCGDAEFYWADPETVGCATCGRKWDKLEWMRRHSPAGVEARATAIEAEFEELTPAPQSPAPAPWQQFAATPPLAPVIGADVTGAADEPEWLAETPTDGTQAAEEGEGAEAEGGEAEVAEAPAAKTDWSQPVKEFKATAPPAPAPKPTPVAPPPPPPAPKPAEAKPAPPPPPPPVIGRAPLGISVSIHVAGTGLLSAMEGDKVIVSSKAIQPSSVMWEIQQLIDGYLSKEETNEPEPASNPV